MPLPTPLRAQGFAVLLLAAIAARGQSASNAVYAARAELAFAGAQRDLAVHPGEAIAAAKVGRTSYDWAEFATNNEQRAAIAQVGIAACHHLLGRDPKSTLGHYYLGMDYGELAEAEAPSMAAYKLIRDIEHEFKLAAEQDERVDFAGPLRCLGLLYRDAPSWPISIGSRHKAREFLDRAAALAPEYPENLMNLLETHIRWHQPEEAEKAWFRLSAIWPAAQTNFVGQAWESDWDDWNTRRSAARANFLKDFKRRIGP